ncbi:MAG: RNHCP domain-containing protein [Bdellovibrionota bacterium]
MSESSRFSKINEEFTCDHCGKTVPLSEKTCRNHCPFCLYSKHVDIFPGDRANPCKGSLKPIGYELHSKKGLMIQFECKSCGQHTRNIALMDDRYAVDNYDLILSLTPKR